MLFETFLFEIIINCSLNLEGFWGFGDFCLMEGPLNVKQRTIFYINVLYQPLQQ